MQRALRDIEGVTCLIYDQTCAAEKRRRRKRGEYPDPDRRIFINDKVCEGCGDCGTQSNCLSVLPLETPFGRKRQIEQSSCNKDFSCVEGFCPSFVTVHGGQLRKSKAASSAGTFPALPEPELPSLATPYGILVTGVGGTGVVTIGAILGMAAHLEGKDHIWPASEMLVEENASRCRAREQETIDILLKQSRASVACALHNVETSRREACSLETLCHHGRHAWRQL